MNFAGNYYYLVTIGLQIICGIHCLRRGRGNWLWLIIFLPVVGSIIYFIMEILPSMRTRGPRIDVGAIVNPGAKIKKLEEDFRFTDTFQNRIKLADAYLSSGQTEQAVELYEDGLTGAFKENEHALGQLTVAYYQLERYRDAVDAASTISRHPQFVRSKAHLYQALSLEKMGQLDAADAEFKKMIGRFSYYEQRYHYGSFLLRNGRNDEAGKVFTAMLDEEQQLSPMERRAAKYWCAKARTEMKAMA
ncbi:tetratricopeptide repeat protein [Mucilaginibacter myungsuensis]|uniref:Tetratricopeptide repeat protein n=1 Tax=Mucilaginibacter myungsuensis TaxID=649104 RepID=A0A929PWJ5_9SPHI|nr:tetratricopeptide repeat protein [Mucilaginibacter myungsuensis]MBE9662151.1 hypothetical protein [Mucilaginibacter myungsuensis]MDN3599415.1 hypothetical protein [Mucilaginibacter myungsuensis]